MMGKERSDISYRIARLIELKKEFGDAVPMEELVAIQYERMVEADGTVRYVPTEIAEKRKAAAAAQSKELEIPKYDRRPFDVLTVPIELTAQYYRDFTFAAYDQLLASFQLPFLESTSLAKVLTHLPGDSELGAFIDDFSVFYNQLPEAEILENFHTSAILFADVLHAELIEHLQEHATFNQSEDEYLYEFVDSCREEDEDGLVDDSMKDHLIEGLEREIATLADLPQLTALRSKSLADPVILIDEDTSEAEFAIQEYLEEIQAQSYLELLQHLFAQYLTAQRLSGLAVRLRQAQSLEEIRAVLTDNSLWTALSEQRKSVGEQIEAARKKSNKSELEPLINQVKAINQQLKSIKGVYEYFFFHETLAQLITDTIRKHQAKVVVGQGEVVQSVLTLDGTPHPKFDDNPGQMSGDCTDGHPLPFDREDVPIFNIKVKDETDKHIGNIYLLQTETVVPGTAVKTGTRVWHLDAIQIPKENINWDQAVRSLIAVLRTAAQQKKVELITVNSESFTISNYPLIRERLLSYLGSDAEKAEIFIPQYQGRDHKGRTYSALQSNGEVLVLWSAEG